MKYCILAKTSQGEMYLEDYFFVEKANGYSTFVTGYEKRAMLFDNPFSAYDVIQKLKTSFGDSHFRIAKFY